MVENSVSLVEVSGGRDISYGGIRRKMARAIRNGTGCTFTRAEVVAILHSDIWMLIMRAEMEELRRESPMIAGEHDDG